ncbi:MAG: hypothetical protein M3033_11485 [Acidobacteriota bacterium]|nr:hypothetical protein [Acidobacteriota bacterium]
MSVNDKKVCEIIKDKINWASGTSRPNHIGNAFDLISEDREKNFPGDPNYAAAEHYLFARWLVGYTSVFGYILIQPSNLIYSAVKGLIGAEHIPRFGKGPVTPASYGDFLWGGRGANDGLGDTFTRIDLFPRSSKPDFPSACK